MTEMRCDRCQYWQPRKALIYVSEFSCCTKVFAASEILSPDQELNPPYADQKIFVFDDYDAQEVWTKADFFCAHFTQIKKKY